MPVNFKGQCKFPKSVKYWEIWSFLLTKAIVKLIQMTQNIDKIDSLTGNGLILYSLTGLWSENLKMTGL